MELLSRMLRSFLILTAVLLTCISLSVDRLISGVSVSDWLDDCISLVEAQHKGEQLSRQTQLATERIRIKGEIVEALRNGKLTLLDAAAYFRSLHEDPKSWHHPTRPLPGQKDGASWCREVIEWTERNMSCQQSPDRSPTLHQRLQSEMQEKLKKHATMTLPE